MELHELVRCLGDSGAQQVDLKKRMRRVGKKDKVLDVPLSKHELEKVVVLTSWFFIARQHTAADARY